MGVPILRTKLYAPRAGQGVVPRERLFGDLEAGSESRLTLVVAPAGFGKTTVVTHWLHDRNITTAWLSLEPADADPVRFWSYVVAALEHTDRFDVSQAAGLLVAAAPDVHAVVTALLNGLSEAPDAGTPVVLVLDDLHVIDAPQVMESLSGFLDYLPDSLRVVATSRTDPELPLSRYRARGELTELRQQQLRFSLQEAQAYLNEGLGFDLPSSALGALVDRTEGWVASLQLAALSLDQLDASAHKDFVEAFAGDDRFVVDYLVDEVLARQPEAVQQFLISTSVLDRLSASLCAHVFGAIAPEASPPSLQELERKGLFLIALDSTREWYRYHHLFADLLRARARRDLDPAALLLRASQWCEAEALYEEAIEYALRAGDVERAATVLETHFPALIGRGEFRTIRQGIGRLPAERVHASTSLCMAMAYVEHISTHLDAAEVWIERGERRLAELDPDQERLRVQRAHLRLLRAFRDEAEQNVAEAEAGYKEARVGFTELEIPFLVCVAEQGLAGTLLAGEHLAQSEEIARSAWRTGMETGNMLVSSTAMNRMAIGLIAQGRLRDADRACRDHLDAVRGTGGAGQLLILGYAHISMADVLICQHRLDEAEAELAAIESWSRKANSHSMTARALMERVRLDRARGDTAGARSALDELDQLFAEDKVLILVRRLVDVLRVRLDLTEGQLVRASEWAATVDEDESFPTRTRITQGDVLAAQGKAREAIATWVYAGTEAMQRGAAGWALEALVRQATALHALRDEQAFVVLERALDLAAPEGYISVFTDVGPELVGLLEVAHARGVTRSVDPTYLQALFAAVRSPAAAENGLLSKRELEVLRLLESGLTNKAVGERLFVSEGTVKRHTHNIYQKLGAKRRTQALVKARSLGLL